MRFNDPSRCPNCRERVTPYAAGCAICGTELDPKRWQRRPSPLSRLAGALRRQDDLPAQPTGLRKRVRPRRRP